MRKSVAPSQLQNPVNKKILFGSSDGEANKASSSSISRRSAVDVLKLIETCDDEETECEKEEIEVTETKTESKTEINCPQNDGKVKESPYFEVLWCKLSTRKHKKWEGDGILEVKQKSVILRNLDGKEIASNFGYAAKELSNLASGSRLKIGGKEVEILDSISRDKIESRKGFSTTTEEDERKTAVEDARQEIKAKVFRNPQKFPAYSAAMRNPKPKHDPLAPDALVMPRPKQSCQWNRMSEGKENGTIVDVVVDPRVSKKLRKHQREGVIFLYECVMGMRIANSHGAILADEMGLGKTLQCIALVWTLHKQGPFGGVAVVRKTLIVTPSSLIKNWKKEFHMWLGKETLSIFTAEGSDKIQEYVRMPTSPVLVLSYELLVRCGQLLANIPFDLIICDEGHRLKNTTTKTATVLGSLAIDRRIVLTGTPLQNDLHEFHAIVEFCNPKFLGTAAEFKRKYCDPIVASRQPGVTELEKDIGEERASELSCLTNLFVLRRTQEVNNEYLPPKMEFVVFCQPTALQLDLYRSLIGSRMFDSCFSQITNGTLHLSCIMALRKVCNHPALLHSLAHDESHSGANPQRDFTLAGFKSLFPPNYTQRVPLEDSGKMRVLKDLLRALSDGEKIVLVSAFTKTLDLFAEMCSRENRKYLRLDGSTPSARRQELVDRFNNASLDDTVFLLSLKAGGVGLNLNGASKIVLYDVDWNPANDLQAMARIWRDGQKNTVHIYRFLTTGTIEEKMFQRQVTKQGLSGAVIDSKRDKNVHFSASELKKLFSLNETTRCETHELIGCKCRGDGSSTETVDRETKSRSCQLTTGKTDISDKNFTMDDLMSWKHYSVDHLGVSRLDSGLFGNSSAITYMFHNVSV